MKKGNKGHTSALYIWNGFSMFWGTSFHTDPHFHNTLQLVFDIDKHFKLKDSTNEWVNYSNAIIKDGHLHQLDSCGSIQLFIYLDRDSDFAKKLCEQYLSDSSMASINNPEIDKFRVKFFKELLVKSDCKELWQGCQFILKTLTKLDATTELDTRVKKAIDYISLSQNKQFKVAAVAEHVCLSESRLRHLFKAEVGQPIQNFILWMKVVDSLNSVLKGQPIGKAALDSGFWDNSHMNRSYKELLGAAPGQLKAYENELKIVACQKGNLRQLRTEIKESFTSNETIKTIQI